MELPTCLDGAPRFSAACEEVLSRQLRPRAHGVTLVNFALFDLVGLQLFRAEKNAAVVQKTQVVYVGDGRQGFDFLGFHCRKVESWKYRGKRYLHQWPYQRAMQRIRDKIRAITAPRHRLPEPVGPIVAEINQALRHWGAYFRVGNSSRKFQQVDDYVRERLALFLSKKSGQHGRRRERYTSAYLKGLGVYRLNGAVVWHTAAPTAVR